MGEGLKRARKAARATRTTRSPLAHDLNLRSSKDRATLRAREAQAKLNALLDGYMRALGVTGKEEHDRVEYKITTPIGELTISPAPPKYTVVGLAIFGRFADPQRAWDRLGDGVSRVGKWNAHYPRDVAPKEAFAAWCRELEWFAPTDVDATQISPGMFSFVPNTDQGREWLLDNVPGTKDDAQPVYCDDTRMAEDIVAGMRRDGLTVLVEG